MGPAVEGCTDGALSGPLSGGTTPPIGLPHKRVRLARLARTDALPDALHASATLFPAHAVQLFPRAKACTDGECAPVVAYNNARMPITVFDVTGVSLGIAENALRRAVVAGGKQI